MSFRLHAPRPRHGAHPDGMLEWDALGVDEITSVAQHLTAPEVIIKPRELHLAFKWGHLQSRRFSRFRKLKLPPARPRFAGKPSLGSRSSTISSVMSMTTMTVSADVSVLVTRPIRRDTTYIVWGAILAVESQTSTVPPRNVIVKIAVDEEGGEDLREDARLHEHLAERGLTGYYGIFTDSIGSTALVIDDSHGEWVQVETPTP